MILAANIKDERLIVRMRVPMMMTRMLMVNLMMSRSMLRVRRTRVLMMMNPE